MSLIDSTYFIREIMIVNKSQSDISTTLTSYITEYEKEILIKLLGRTLYNLFITGTGVGSPAQIWLDLRDGADFTLDYYGTDVPLHWNGLTNSDLISLISYYVFYYYMRDIAYQTSGMGVVQSDVENASPVSPAQKLVSAWNKMVDLAGKIRYYDGWKECYLTNSDYIVYNTEPSLYNFLLTNLADYPTWVFEPQQTINEFGF